MAQEFPLDAANPEQLEKVAREVGAGTLRVSTLLRPTEYQLLSLEAPPVPREELKTAVRWKLKDMLDFHVDDATLDVLDVPVDPNGASRSHMMFAVAARNSLIQQRQALFGDARIDLEVIDIPEMAQRNLAALAEPQGRALAMLSFSDDGGLLTVTFKGELYLSRRIDVPPSHLSEQDYERRNAAFDRITLELQRSLDHFDRQFNYLSIAKLLLTPVTFGGLEEYLSSNLYTPVEPLDLASVLDLSAVPALADKANQQRYLSLIGAALREELVLP
ncbi:MAG: agglutinin biogenesis protein MshI [Telluria sp.]